MASSCLNNRLLFLGLGCAVSSWLAACNSREYAVATDPDQGGKTAVSRGGSSNTGGRSASGGTRDAGGASERGGASESGGESFGGTAGTSSYSTIGTTGDPNDCHSDADCSGMAVLRTCDTATAICVECLPGKTACGAGLYCGTNKECHVGCAANADCSTGTCDSARNQCTGCTSNAACGAGTACDTTTSVCSPSCDTSATCPSGWGCCAGSCVNLNLDEANCGSCATSCSRQNATVQCREAACVIQGCLDGYANCNDKAVDGCEADLLAQAENCGTCGTACATPLVCKAGVCGAAACDQGFVDCDGKVTNGCETNTQRDIANCGACASACNAANGTATCAAGACSITCNSGWGNCDGNANNGCEVNLTDDLPNCGRCGVECTNNHGEPYCIAGRCVPSCGTGFGDCDGIATNGCEATLLADTNNCGTCGTICNLPHATAGCTSGACSVVSCADGWADCNALSADGCEVNLLADPAHCGSCSTACSTANGTASCALGACSITCASNYANCDSTLSNGCETNLTNTVKHCGSCEVECKDATNGTAVCKASACGISSCSSPYGDCDGNSSNGCESNSKTDVNNCGGCGSVCSLAHATAACTSGTCTIASCAAGWADCNGIATDGCEVNLLMNNANCGACSAACAPSNATGSCVAGVCSITSCSVNYSDCNGSVTDGCEVNTQTNVNNCGACKAACSSVHGTPTCTAGSCSIACASGFGNCDSSITNGCEMPISADASNCGTCNNVCAPKNATGTCQSGVCGIGSCSTNFSDCDGTYATGCEVNLTTDPSNCNVCGDVCSTTNGIASCASATCGISCTGGYASCDSDVSDGCETDISADRNNCGGCNIACNAASTGCTAGACATPCTGFCTNPKVVTISSGGTTISDSSFTDDPFLNTKICYETYDATKAWTDGGCGNFAAEHSLYINGKAMSCSSFLSAKPAAVNGGYCFHDDGKASNGSPYITIW